MLEDFAQAQAEHCSKLGDKLTSEWRRAFVEQVVDNVQDTFDFYQSDEERYEGGDLKKLLRHFELRQKQQLRDILSLSVSDWVSFVARFCEKGAATEGRSTPPLFQASLNIAFDVQDAMNSSGRMSRFGVPKVKLSPTPEDLEVALLARIMEPVDIVRTLTNLRFGPDVPDQTPGTNVVKCQAR